MYLILTLTDRVSIVPSNIRGCRSGTWSAGQKNIRGTSTKLQREHDNKTKQNRTKTTKKKGVTQTTCQKKNEGKALDRDNLVYCQPQAIRFSRWIATTSHLHSKGRFERSEFCFQISKFPKLRKSQRGVLPKYSKNFGSYWGPRNLEPLAFNIFSPFQICVAPAHKGDIRASYAVPQVVLNSTGSLDIGWAMADRRNKRGAPSGLVPSSRPRQRFRISSDHEGMLQRMEAAAVIGFVLSTVVRSVVVHCLLPTPRQIIHEPRRLDWEELWYSSTT